MNISFRKIMEHRNGIYAITAVWIVFFHIYEMLRMPKYFGVAHIFAIGNIGVDIFLFLSAIGLSFSIEKRSLKEFYKNRIIRIFIPWLLITVPYFILFEIKNGFSLRGIFSVFLDISTLSFWFEKDFANIATWYVSFIVVLYLLFPLLFKIYKKGKGYIIALLFIIVVGQVAFMQMDIDFFKNYEIVFTRIPIFLFGIFISDYVKRDYPINIWQLIAAITIFLIAFYFCFDFKIPVRRYLYGIMTLPFTVLCAWILNFIKFRRVHNILNLIGSNSLEIFLTHSVIIRLIQIFNFKYNQFWVWYYILILGASIVLSLMCSKISNRIILMIKNKDEYNGK